MAGRFRKGDFRSGYYRDQTFMFATGHADARAVLRPALRPRRRRGRALVGRPADDRPLRHAHARRRRHLEGPHRDATTRPPTSRPTGSQMPRLVGLGYASKLYRAARRRCTGSPDFSNERQRGRLRHDRQRQLRRGDVLGVGQRHRRAAGARGDLDLGRRLRHLGAQRVPDHQGRDLRAPGRVSSARRAASRASTSTASRAGTTRRCARPIATRPRRRAASTCPAIVHVTEMTQPQGHSTSGSHERYKSRGAAGLGRGVRLPPQDARSGCSTEGDRRRGGARAHRGGGPAARRASAWPGPGRPSSLRSARSGTPSDRA